MNYKNTWEYKIAVWYLYLLPIRMILPFAFLRELFHGAAVYFDFVLHALGILLMICSSFRIRYDREDRSLFRYFLGMIIWFNLSSVLMAAVVQIYQGNYGTESAFDGILGMEIYFFQYVLILCYNRRIFHLLTLEKLSKIIYRVCVFLLVVGYVQILVVELGLGSYYESLDFLDIFADMEMIEKKVSLTSSEGAGAGTIIGIFVLPFLLSQVILKKQTKKIVTQLILWLPVIFYTRSTVCYMLVLIDYFVFMLLVAKDIRRVLSYALIFGIVAIVGVRTIASKDLDEMSYLLTEKAFDEDNGSRASRMAPFYINWYSFLDYPIFGIGNGLQGYYTEYIPRELIVQENSDLSDFLERNKGQISNAGLFFPGIFSGYGICGTILFIIFLYKSVAMIVRRRNRIGEYYYFYIIAFPAILLSGFQEDFCGNYMTWFVLSLPLLKPLSDKSQPQPVDQSGNRVEKR